MLSLCLGVFVVRPSSFPILGMAVDRAYNAAMHIPHTQLPPATLRAVVAEFVTRDGTDHSQVERRIEMVLAQLEKGVVALYYDEEDGTCNVVSAKPGKP